MAVEKQLSYLYYKDYGNPAFFTGNANVLLKQYRIKKYTPSIKIKDVEQFLTKQSVYGLHRKQINKFPRNKIYSMFQGDILAADLADMVSFKSQNDGNGYILFVIDSFSKKGYAAAVKRKTADLTLLAFRKILNKIKYKIRNICVDNGTEFQAVFKKWCKNEKMNLYTVDGDKKNAIVERFIQTIKGRLWRYFRYEGSHRWIDILPKMIQTYNASYHKSIKMSPNQVNNGNSHIVYKTMFPRKVKKQRSKLKIGDAVRISIKLDDRAKKYEGKYSLVIYLIKKIKYNINGKYPLYKVAEAYNDKPFPGWLYKEQLLKVDKDTFDSRKTLYDLKVLEKRGGKSLIEWVGYEGPPEWVKTSSIVKNFRKQY